MPPAALPLVSRDVARRLLLHGQGLLDDPARRLTPRHLTQAIERMGFVQIDSINVVARAHHLTLASRFDDYRPAALVRLLEETRDLFEHWTHDAAAIPTRWFPHWRHRFELQRRRIEASKWWRERLGSEPRPLLDRVERRVRDQGPVLAKDVLEPDGKGSSGWWTWTPEKAALECLWHTGRLAVTRRVGFQKVYDLMARVLPDHHALPRPSEDEHLDWAARGALERLGVATPGELAAFWHLVSIEQAAAWCAARAAAGEIARVRVEGGEGARAAYAVRDWEKVARRAPDAPDRIRLLSPFDPILRDRHRTMRLFGFDYRFEAFVPASQRRYGYYVLPILERDRLVGRVEPKLHRERGVLEVRGLWWEPGVKPTKARKQALDAALARLAAMVGATAVERR